VKLLKNELPESQGKSAVARVSERMGILKTII
jgi:hypothetical protein